MSIIVLAQQTTSLNTDEANIYGEEQSVVIGYDAAENSGNGSFNVFLGYRSGYDRYGNSEENVFIGAESGSESRYALGNSVLGFRSGYRLNNSSNYNSIIGYEAAYDMNGSLNLILGYKSGVYASGDNNIYLGNFAGNSNYGNNNIFIGQVSGEDWTPNTSYNNKLIIDNTFRPNPFIDGDFQERTLTLNADVVIPSNYTLTAEGLGANLAGTGLSWNGTQLNLDGSRMAGNGLNWSTQFEVDYPSFHVLAGNGLMWNYNNSTLDLDIPTGDGLMWGDGILSFDGSALAGQGLSYNNDQIQLDLNVEPGLHFFGNTLGINFNQVAGPGLIEQGSQLAVNGIELAGDNIVWDGTSFNVNFPDLEPQLWSVSGDDIYYNGDLRLKSGAYMDDDVSMGGSSDDWIRLNGYVELSTGNSDHGVVLREYGNTNYMSITQKGGWSYLSDNTTYGNYFLRGNGADVEVRGNLTAGGEILASSGNSLEWNEAFTQRGSVIAGAGLLWEDGVLKVDGSQNLDNLGNHTATTNLNMNDQEIRNLKAIQLKDWDDNTGGTDNKYRLLARDGAFQFYSGGVVVGNYPNNQWTDVADGTLIVENVVGVGTPNPTDGLLHVYRDATTGEFGSITPSNAGVRIQDSGADMYLDGNSIFTSSTMNIGTSGANPIILGTNNSERLRILANGNVGIGISPTEKLHVAGNILSSGTVTADRMVLNNQETDSSPSEGSIYYDRNAYSDSNGFSQFFTGGNGGAIAHYNPEDGWGALLATNNMMYIRPRFHGLDVDNDVIVSGKLAINSSVFPTIDGVEYDLVVGGDILTEEVNVLLQTDWPDYVFANDYNLAPLNEVEEYIKENHHLPEVPSAQEVELEGIRLGEMDAALLKKIEELTLHVIDQNKKIEMLLKRVQELESK